MQLAAIVLATMPLVPAPDVSDTAPLTRRYTEGETARYVMTGSHQGREHTVKYEAEAEGEVKRDGQGRFVEEFRWTRLELGGNEIPLGEASASFRQRVSLDPGVEMTPPDVGSLHPVLLGPVFDLMTFYVDLHPSLHQSKLRKPGDRVRVPHGRPNSWADGTRVVIGEDCIDFDLTLDRLDDTGATLRVRHVPPEETSVRLPAPWMQERVNPASPNNWVQVQRGPEADPARFVAAAGHEVFDVKVEVERPSGRIVAAVMENPVDVVQRHCKDAELTECGDPVKYRILRRVELKRIP